MGGVPSTTVEPPRKKMRYSPGALSEGGSAPGYPLALRPYVENCPENMTYGRGLRKRSTGKFRSMGERVSMSLRARISAAANANEIARRERNAFARKASMRCFMIFLCLTRNIQT